MTLTATERGDLAERLIPIAAALSCVVHGDGDRQAVAHILNQLDPTERDALIVVLAGLVDPEQSLGQALGYLTWDEHGAPAEPPTTAKTVRQAAALIYPPTEQPTRRTAEIVEDTTLLVIRGLSRAEIASRLQISWGYVQQAHSREGVRVPEVAA
ncbi:hypothetical protein [Kitasatospora phosalacinea]|uniref:Uncharacterized protein n=1 Tax=Kitasatospora phosalacinea TaxID=2065 RepID=A0ABW6GR92_9ACTN